MGLEVMAGKEPSAIRNGTSEIHPPLTEGTGSGYEALAVSEVQLLLAEKRTSLAALRTGIAVFVLPVSVLSVLIATSKYYDFIHVLHFIIPLLLLSAALVFLASYLIIRAVIRMRHQDKLITEIKKKHPMIAQFID
jgi:uncharacterized membrane protein YkgB